MINFTDTPILNEQTINTIITQTRGNDELVQEIFKSFVYEVQEMINNINLAISKYDYKEFKFLTHTIKGLSATIGASQLHIVAKHIDFLIKENKPLEAITYVPLLTKTYDDCKKQVMEKFKIL